MSAETYDIAVALTLIIGGTLAAALIVWKGDTP